jgi:hypothetical protein
LEKCNIKWENFCSARFQDGNSFIVLLISEQNVSKPIQEKIDYKNSFQFLNPEYKKIN